MSNPGEQNNKKIQGKKLQAGMASFEALFDHIPAALMICDSRGNVIHLNKQAQAFFDHKDLDELQPRSWPRRLGFYLDDQKTPYPAQKFPLVRAIKGEVVLDEEMILKPEEDHPGKWVNLSAQPVTLGPGEFEGVVVVFNDISSRKRLESEKDRQANRAQVLYQLSRALASIGSNLQENVDMVVKHVSKEIGDACLIALLKDDRSKVALEAFHHPDERASALLRQIAVKGDYELGDGFLTGVIQTGEAVFMPKLNKAQAEALLSPLFSGYIQQVGVSSLLVVPIVGRERILGLLALSRDTGSLPYSGEQLNLLNEIAHRTGLAIEHCTLLDSLQAALQESKRVAEALAESEARFRSIFESTALGMKILDTEGKILQVNPAFSAMTGYSNAELVNHHFTEFIHPADRNHCQLVFQELLDHKSDEVKLHHRFLHKEGSLVWFNATLNMTPQNPKNGNDDLVVFFNENVTEQKLIEKEMIELKNHLQQSVELERLHMAQEIHDGPMQELYSAIFQLESLRKQLVDENKAVLVGVKKDIQSVLDELRAFSKELRPPTIGKFGLEKAIRSHVEDFQEKYPQLRIHLHLAHDRQLLPENTRLALFRIYQTALANVVRHAEASEVEVHFTLDAEEVRLSIADNGKGFEVPKNWVLLARNGHFGLAGAAERVEAMDGKMEVNSTPGKGTRLQIVIPIGGEE